MVTTTSVSAESEPSASAPSLLQIMRDMGVQMQTITHAITLENWSLVADSASKIAHHPSPPMAEKKRIKAFLKTNMGKFKAYDSITHKAAQDLSNSALQEDKDAVVDNFASLHKGCLGCHQNFRSSLRENVFLGNSRP